MQRNKKGSFTQMDEDVVVKGKTYLAAHSYRYQLDDRKPDEATYYNVVLAGLASPEVASCLHRAQVFCSYNAHDLARGHLIFITRGDSPKALASIYQGTIKAGFYVEDDELKADTEEKKKADNETVTVFSCQ